MDDNLTKNKEKYIQQLTEQEKEVLKLAKEILQSSFTVEKSIGFLEWQKNNIK